MKSPLESVTRGLGTVGTGVPSHVIVIVESALKVPTTVVDAIPVSGTIENMGTMLTSRVMLLLATTCSSTYVSTEAVIV